MNQTISPTYSVEASVGQINVLDRDAKKHEARLVDMTSILAKTKERLQIVTRERNKYITEVKDLKGKLEAAEFLSSTIKQHLHETIAKLEASKEKTICALKSQNQLLNLAEKLN